MKKIGLLSLCALSVLGAASMSSCSYESGRIKVNQDLIVYVASGEHSFGVRESSSGGYNFFTDDGVIAIENEKSYPKYQVGKNNVNGYVINIDCENYHWEFAGNNVSYCFYSYN